MFDELLGHAALKRKIERLKDERESLEAQLAAESDRRAEAASARQDAEERVNRLEDRIADLEGRLEHAGSEATEPEVRRTERCRGDRLRTVLSRLESLRTEDEGALTAMVGDELPAAVTDVLGGHAALVRRAAPCLLVADDAGLVAAALGTPDPPDPFVEWGDRFRIDRGWFLPRGDHAIALVRSDTFVMGDFAGDGYRRTAGFESDVAGDHSKGGFSQARFERRRDEQIKAHLDRVRETIREQDPDRLLLVGEGTVVDRLADMAARTGRVDVGGSDTDALEAAAREFWTTTVRGL